MNKVVQIDAKLLEKVKKYVVDNYVAENEEECYKAPICRFIKKNEMELSNFEVPEGLKNINYNINFTWQQSVFHLIDKKDYTDPEVYKRASISKQTFSKIRCDVNYQPNKDTAIQMCIGLKLNLDETYDLMEKAGYTLSASIKRDLVVRYFIEEKIYRIDDLNIVLDEMNLKLFPIN